MHFGAYFSDYLTRPGSVTQPKYIWEHLQTSLFLPLLKGIISEEYMAPNVHH